MEKCYCQQGHHPGDYTSIDEFEVDMGFLGKTYVTLGIVGMKSRLCFEVYHESDNAIEKKVDIKYCPFCGRRLEWDN